MYAYIKNIIAALMGRNPYRDELDELQERYDKAAQNVSSLYEMYYSAVDRWDKTDKQVRSLQALVENLRKRIGEKDALMREMEAAVIQRQAEQ